MHREQRAPRRERVWPVHLAVTTLLAAGTGHLLSLAREVLWLSRTDLALLGVVLGCLVLATYLYGHWAGARAAGDGRPDRYRDWAPPAPPDLAGPPAADGRGPEELEDDGLPRHW